MHGSIFASEFDKNKNLICHMRETHFCAVDSLGTVLHNLGVFFVSCLSIGVVQTVPMKSPYCIPAKKLLAEYLVNRSPPAPFTWLNLYLGSKIIRDSNVYVMTSEVSATDYKKLQNISAFLKGKNFIILLQIIQKTYLFNGLLEKWFRHI